MRSLARQPGFTAIACTSLAIGIGATTAAFGVWDAVLLRSLPVRDPGALVLLTWRNAGAPRAMSHPAFLYLRDRASSLAGLAAFRPASVNVTAGVQAERVTAMLVSGNYFDVLGVAMAQGTAILPDDDRVPRSGGSRGLVAVLSHEFWRRRFDGQPTVVGRTLRVNGHAVTVVGVAPRGFHGTAIGSVPAVYLPMMFASHIYDGPWLENPRNLWLRTIGRLGPGTSIQQAGADLTTTFRQFYQDVVVPIANDDAARRRAREAAVVLEPGRAGLLELGDTVRPALSALLGLVGIVMLTACINVAGLMVARAERLHKDTAIALALGASRMRLWGRTLAESVAIGMGGVGLGLIFAFWTRDVLARLVAGNTTLDVRLDGRVFTVAMVSGLVASLLVGALTAWSQTRLDIIRALKGNDLPARLALRKVLIAGQLAFSVVVLVTAALFARTLAAVHGVDAGFATDSIVVASTAPAAYSPERRRAFYTRLLREIRTVPGVVSAALAGHEPLDVRTGWSIRPRHGTDVAQPTRSASVAFVSPDYFRTMGIALLRGRDFTPEDVMSASSPIVVNENFARTYLPGVDPIGARIDGNGPMTFDIVGVVRDSAAFSLRDLDQQVMYVPSGEGVLHVRASVAPGVIQAAIGETVRRIDAGVPVYNVRTIEEVLDRFLVRERTLALVSSMFALLALALVAVGLYGVVSNGVSRRTKEFGIRLALGAGPGSITRAVLADAIRLLAIGIAAAIPLVLGIGRVIRTLLFGVPAFDLTSLGAAAVVLTVVAGLAAWIPARRAASVDPLVALKSE